MTAWHWIQAHNAEMGWALVIFLLSLIAFVAWRFRCGEKKDREADDAIPPADRALWDMPEDEFRIRTGLPAKKGDNS